MYEASEHNGPVMHYYVIVASDDIAQLNHPNDFDIDQVVLLLSPESFCGDYVITGVRLSVCLSVTTITK